MHINVSGRSVLLFINKLKYRTISAKMIFLRTLSGQLTEWLYLYIKMLIVDARAEEYANNSDNEDAIADRLVLTRWLSIPLIDCKSR